jgi:hypothetical protein
LPLAGSFDEPTGGTPGYPLLTFAVRAAQITSRLDVSGIDVAAHPSIVQEATSAAARGY